MLLLFTVLVTTPEPVSSQPPTPSSQCPSARCSKNATCVPQSSGSPRCVCVDGFVGDGYICVGEYNRGVSLMRL